MTNTGEWTLLRSIAALRWCNVDTVFELPLKTSRRLAVHRMQMFLRSCACRERSGPALTWNDMKCLHPRQSEKTSWVLYWRPMWEYLLGCEQLKFSQATLNKQRLPRSLASTPSCFHGNNGGGLWLRLSHGSSVTHLFLMSCYTIVNDLQHWRFLLSLILSGLNLCHSDAADLYEQRISAGQFKET